MKKIILIALVALHVSAHAQKPAHTDPSIAAKEKYGNYGPVLDMIAQGIIKDQRNAKLNEAIKNTPKVVTIKTGK